MDIRISFINSILKAGGDEVLVVWLWAGDLMINYQAPAPKVVLCHVIG